jgi:excisionase family DNA binding protein
MLKWSDGSNKRYLDVKEVAEEYGVAVSTVYKMVCQRRIPFVKIGRRTKFDRRQLHEWLISHTVKDIESFAVDA